MDVLKDGLTWINDLNPYVSRVGKFVPQVELKRAFYV